jgi:phosphate transport system substrate-binding protein
MKKWIALVVALLALPVAASAGPVTVKGSDTMVILVQRWAEEYMKRNPAAKLQVTGGGSGVGIAALINGTTEIASASRAIKDAEKKQLLDKTKQSATEIAVAKDGVTFYVSEKNPLSALTMEQLRDIYLGDVTNWKEVGGPDAPIVLYSRENSSGTYAFVKEELLKNGDFAPNAQTLPGTAAVVNAVSKDKNGIGYGGAAYAKGVKELKITVGKESIEPSAANVKSGKYPMSRSLFFYTRGVAAGDAKGFIDFCLSPAGQQVAEKVGYFPLK